MTSKVKLILILVAVLTAVNPAGRLLAGADKAATSPLTQVWLDIEGRELPFGSDEEILEYLRSANVIGSKRVGEGINKTRKLTLEKDGVRMHAAFRQVKSDRNLPNPLNPAFTSCHRDDYRFEVAAYLLSRRLGLPLVPPTIIRKIDGHEGSLQAWVEESMMEKTRREKGLAPPDQWYWMSQMLTMRLFDSLVANIDRHQGNLLIDRNWEIRLIDHTQAFRRWNDLVEVEKLQYCSREVWKRLDSIDRAFLETECGDYLREPEIKSLLQRKDKLLKHIAALIEKNGADRVLF